METGDRSLQLPEKPLHSLGAMGDGEWRRLAPLSILSELIHFAMRSVIGLIAITFFLLRDGDTQKFVRFMPLILFAFAVAPVVQWFRFRYSVGHREIRIEQGLLARSLRIIPMERIVDVAIERKPVHRLFGLAKVSIETGGGGKEDDGALDALTRPMAEELRDVVRAAQQSQQGTIASDGETMVSDDAVMQREPETILFAMTTVDLITGGLFNFSLTFIAVVGASLNQFDFLIPVDVYNPEFWFDQLGRGRFLLELGWLTQAIAAAAAILSLLILGAITGIIRTVLRDFGFSLSRTERGMRRRRGLLTQSDVVMPVHRIQSAIITTGPVRRWFGYYALSVESLARDADKQDNHSVAPHARLHEVQTLLEEIDLNLAAGQPVHGRILPVMLGGWIWAIVLIGIGSAIFLSDLQNSVLAQGFPWIERWLPFAAFGLMLFGIWSAVVPYLNWRTHHYWIADGHIFVRQGWWNQRLIILPLIKLQSVDWTQGPLTQMLGVAKIRFGVAGGSALAPHDLPWLPIAEAEALRVHLINPAAAVDYSVLVRSDRNPA